MDFGRGLGGLPGDFGDILVHGWILWFFHGFGVFRGSWRDRRDVLAPMLGDVGRKMGQKRGKNRICSSKLGFQTRLDGHLGAKMAR